MYVCLFCLDNGNQWIVVDGLQVSFCLPNCGRYSNRVRKIIGHRGCLVSDCDGGDAGSFCSGSCFCLFFRMEVPQSLQYRINSVSQSTNCRLFVYFLLRTPIPCRWIRSSVESPLSFSIVCARQAGRQVDGCPLLRHWLLGPVRKKCTKDDL